MAAYEQFFYTLQEQEMINGLQTCGLYKGTGKRGKIESGMLAGLFVLFTVFFFMRWEWFDLAIAGVCAVIGVLLNLLPYLDMKKKAKECDKEINMRVYPYEIYVYLEKQTISVPLKKGTKITYSKKKAVYTVRPQNGGLLVIPERVIPQEKREKIKRMFLEGQQSQ